MRKSYKKFNRDPILPTFFINERIRAKEVRLIDENNEMIGVVTIEEAFARAKEAELDLIEVSPKAVPPVCKIIDYGSFKYKQEKEAKAQKLKQKVSEMKGIRLSLRIGKHDTDVRIGQANKFLEDNDKVKIEMILKGRERQQADQAKEIMEGFVKELGDKVKVEQPFTRQGGKLSMVLAPKK